MGSRRYTAGRSDGVSMTSFHHRYATIFAESNAEDLCQFVLESQQIPPLPRFEELGRSSFVPIQFHAGERWGAVAGLSSGPRGRASEFDSEVWAYELTPEGWTWTGLSSGGGFPEIDDPLGSTVLREPLVITVSTFHGLGETYVLGLGPPGRDILVASRAQRVSATAVTNWLGTFLIRLDVSSVPGPSEWTATLA